MEPLILCCWSTMNKPKFLMRKGGFICRDVFKKGNAISEKTTKITNQLNSFQWVRKQLPNKYLLSTDAIFKTTFSSHQNVLNSPVVTAPLAVLFSTDLAPGGFYSCWPFSKTRSVRTWQIVAYLNNWHKKRPVFFNNTNHRNVLN